MNKISLSLIVLFSLCFQGHSQLGVSGLLCENRVNPIGIDQQKPRLSWQLVSDSRNVMQTAYELRVGTDASLVAKGKNLVWTSGKQNGDASVFIPYEGKSLESGKRYYWQVRVWDNQGNRSTWSIPASWQMGMLNKNDWKARWISPGFMEDSIQRPTPLFRKSFQSRRKIRNATAYITAHGLYEARLNGQRIGDAFLTPGWTVYSKRLQYQVYDITGLVQTGNNTLGIMLGNGWYRGTIGFSNNQNVYGKDISLLFQLDIRYEDGSTETVVSDDTWKSSTGAVRNAEIYNGETIDARMEKTGWDRNGYNDAGWAGVEVKNFPLDNLLATYNETIQKHETFKPVRVFTTPKGEQVLDFGQNLVGWVMVKARGKQGDTIVVKHAEVLDKQGNFYTENLRAAKATDTYVLAGGKEEVFEPHFTFHGFRFIRVEGLEGKPNPDDFTAVALYSDMRPTGEFSSSNPLINQLQHNIQWGQKGNFLDVPTDCPQRDERLGWTGDAQVFSRTATFNMGVNNFFAKWLKDLAADQGANGAVPFVIPNILGQPIGACGWADAATIIPWNIYLAYGDRQVLENQYVSMKGWVEYIRKTSRDDLWNSGFHFGDWLSYMQDNDLMGRSAITDKYLISQCFYAHSTQLLINAAKVLDKNEEAAEYTRLLEKIKEAFVKEYVTTNGRLVSGTQTAYVLALQFDMLPESMREQAVERLVQNLKDYGNHLSTGFLGTPYLCHVLSRFGKTELAFQLLLQESYPSWLYPVKMGATTIWERWNGIRPDSSFEPASMNSFNHYAYGAIGDWMYRVVAGLDTYEDGPGYKHIRIEPHIGGKFTRVSASLLTYYGKTVSAWSRSGDTLDIYVEIPPNAKATLYLPAADLPDVTESGKALSSVPAMSGARLKNGRVELETGSGKYQFRIVHFK